MVISDVGSKQAGMPMVLSRSIMGDNICIGCIFYSFYNDHVYLELIGIIENINYSFGSILLKLLEDISIDHGHDRIECISLGHVVNFYKKNNWKVGEKLEDGSIKMYRIINKNNLVDFKIFGYLYFIILSLLILCSIFY